MTAPDHEIRHNLLQKAVGFKQYHIRLKNRSNYGGVGLLTFFKTFVLCELIAGTVSSTIF
jgi:hypothetical protein